MKRAQGDDEPEAEPRFVLRVPSDVSLRLRWGCDADDDGTVEGSAVADASIGVLTRDLPLDLRLLSAEGLALVTPRATGGLRLPADGALVAPEGAVGPANALAPADGAVGPPLPNGPPANAGPPPPSGTTPPP